MKDIVKAMPTWIVKAYDGQTNDRWEVSARTRQDAKDYIAVTRRIPTTWLTAVRKK